MVTTSGWGLMRRRFGKWLFPRCLCEVKRFKVYLFSKHADEDPIPPLDLGKWTLPSMSGAPRGETSLYHT